MSKTKTVLMDDSTPDTLDKKKKKGKTPKKDVAAPVEAQIVTMTAVTPTQKTAKTKKQGKEKTRGKKYKLSATKIDPNLTYSVADAINLAKSTSYSKFVGKIELHIVLKNGSFNKIIEMPHLVGKSKKVEIASEETIEKLKNGKIDFDVLIAEPTMMPKLVPFARILGPKGLMPNPKNGTVAVKPEEAAKRFSGNSHLVKSELKAPLIHTIIGKTDQPVEEIKENLEAILNATDPRLIAKAVISASMGPSIKVALSA